MALFHLYYLKAHLGYRTTFTKISIAKVTSSYIPWAGPDRYLGNIRILLLIEHVPISTIYNLFYLNYWIY